jgi:hypothetical protein
MYFQTDLIDNMAIFIYKKGQPLFFTFLAGFTAKDHSYLTEKEGETRVLTPYYPYPGCPGDKLNLYMKNGLSSFFYPI